MAEGNTDNGKSIRLHTQFLTWYEYFYDQLYVHAWYLNLYKRVTEYNREIIIEKIDISAESIFCDNNDS